jgi:murein DD-endopeptidase MepM/ murein hydrolase activator NlpD
MTDRSPDRPRSRRRLLHAVVALAVLANLALLLPYARGLWWLHAATGAPARLVLPVAGVVAAALQPSFGVPRVFGPHEGIDIAAPFGTPVLAAADGVVIGNRVTRIGGNVVWIMGAGRRLYYYAHLRELAPGMRMGRRVAAGEQLGTVGNTGNAAATLPHLHFAIYTVSSSFYPLRYEALDPYPLLVNGAR